MALTTKSHLVQKKSVKISKVIDKNHQKTFYRDEGTCSRAEAEGGRAGWWEWTEWMN